MNRSKPQYYVRIDSLWQNSPDRYVGPFDSRQVAQAEIDRAMDAEGSCVISSGQYARDLRDTIRVHGILTRTEALKLTLNEDPIELGGNVIGDEIPLSLGALREYEIQMGI